MKEEAAMSKIDVSVMYRERILLPENAMLKVTLEDISLADAPSKTIAQTEMTLTGAPPYNTTLNFKAADLTANNTYGIRATIHVDEALRFTSDTTTASRAAASEEGAPLALSFDKEPVQIIVKAVQAQAMAPQADLSSGAWELQTLAGVEIGEMPVTPSLQVDLSGGTISGNSGCNAFRGTVTAEGETLTFSKIASTKKMCVEEEVMVTEQGYLKALESVSSYRIEGKNLTLLTAEGAPVASYTLAELKAE